MLTTLACGAALLGCPDPDGLFDDFAERLEAKPTGPEGDCGEPVQQVDGTFFFALSTQLAKKAPIVLLAEVTTSADGMQMSLQPLRSDDRATPVGDPIQIPATPLDAQGRFEVTLSDLFIPADALSISDDDVVASTLTLNGTACEDFICGGARGLITEPVPITLTADKSKFAAERIDTGAPYPEPPRINCLDDLALPIGDL